ncbi:hypothetical protein Tco_0989242 [Tanacetum coccineum]|uniref:Uncharacterized protein n=1 Tax=Tanacetum coccineum TaxID=301880 RepID=A0ABQ5ETM8_9ASTR
MFESGSYISQPEHAALFDTLDVSMDRENREEFIEATNKSPWHTSDTKEAPSSSSKQKTVPQSEQPVDDVPIPDDVHISNSEDTDAAYLLKIKTRPDWLKPNNWANAISNAYKDTEENKLIQKTRDIDPSSNGIASRLGSQSSAKLIWKVQLSNQIDLVNPEGNRVVPDVSKPLPIGGPPGQVIIQSQYFFNKDLEYLVSGDKERSNALSISKLKAVYYLDFGLEELVPSLWINTILVQPMFFSVVSLKTFSRYDYTFLREIVLRRADYKEYKISIADFKNLHSNDFEDMYLLHLQGNLNHLSGADKLSNEAQPSWDATNFLFKEDYTIIHKPKVIIYRDRNNQKKMMRETEFNPGMEHRIRFEDDKRRSKELFEVIERRLKIRRFFRSLESFVNGRLRDVDYRLIQRTE